MQRTGSGSKYALNNKYMVGKGATYPVQKNMQIVTCAACEGVHEASNFMSHENIFMSCHCTIEVVKNATQPMKHCLYLTKMEEKNKNTMKYIYKGQNSTYPNATALFFFLWDGEDSSCMCNHLPK